MKRINIPYDYIVFLAAYLRMAGLSLDRSRWTSLNELADFYKRTISPSRVLVALKAYQQSDFECSKRSYQLKHLSPGFALIKFNVERVLYRTHLSEAQYCQAVEALTNMDKLLTFDPKVYEKFESILSSIADLEANISSQRIFRRDSIDVERVEHYMQSDHSGNKRVPFSKFLKNINI